MATDVTIYVDPDATGSNNGTSWVNAYTSIVTAYTTEAKDIVSSDEIYIFLCRNSGGSALAMGNLNGFTTDTTRYTVIRAATGYEAVKTGWDDDRVRIESTDTVLGLQDNYMRVEGMQIRNNFSTGTFSTGIYVNAIVGGGADIRISSCRVEGNGNDSSYNYGIDINDGDATVNIFDTIIYNHHRDLMRLNAGTCNLYNSVLAYEHYATGNGIQVGASGTLTCYNTAVFQTPDDFDNAGSSTIDHCASDDGDGTNAVSPSGADWDNEFTDPSNGDFALLNTGNLYQGGTDDPGSGLYSTDMEGDSFNSPWDIGPDSYAAPTGGIVGDSSGSSTVSGTLAGAGALTGNIDTDSDMSGGLTGLGALAGDSDSATTAAGAITGLGSLSGNIDTDSVAAGLLVGDGALIGVSAGSSVLDGSLTGDSGSMTGASYSSLTVIGSLTGAGALSGDIDTNSLLQGVLSQTGGISGYMVMEITGIVPKIEIDSLNPKITIEIEG